MTPRPPPRLKQLEIRRLSSNRAQAAFVAAQSPAWHLRLSGYRRARLDLPRAAVTRRNWRRREEPLRTAPRISKQLTFSIPVERFLIRPQAVRRYDVRIASITPEFEVAATGLTSDGL